MIFDPMLALAADVVDDLERVRIANENRFRQLTRDEADKDGQRRGFELDLDHPDVARLAPLIEALKRAEHDATLNLKRRLRNHPLGPFIKNAKGIGDKQGARLLAAIGDPYWHSLYDRPRTVRELFAYCGYGQFNYFPGDHEIIESHNSHVAGDPPSDHHVVRESHGKRVVGSSPLTDHQPTESHVDSVGGDLACGHLDHIPCDSLGSSVGVAASLVRGQKCNWSNTAKKRAWLISKQIVKVGQGGPYREEYDQGRIKYANAVHLHACRRCGPKGQPAPAGSPLSDGHKHARALRLVAKRVLKDLWREAKRIHETS